METSELEYNQLKEKYWKPEWDSISEEEKFKDPQYCGYLYEMLVIGLKYAKEERQKCKNELQIELADEFIKFYEKALGHFTPLEE